MRICPQRHAKRAGQAKIREFEVPIAIDEEVLRLEVAMQHAMAVTVTDALDELGHELLDHGGAEPELLELLAGPIRQSLAAAALAHGQGLHVLLQVQIQELEHQVQLLAVGVHDVQQSHDVRVVHLLQQRDLADGRARYAFVLGLQPDLLEGHDPVWVSEVARLVDDAISAWRPVWASVG